MRAAETAARDQVLALARDVATTSMPVLLIDLPQGEGCCWCNCPPCAADDITCGGCTSAADAVLRVYPEPETGDFWPVCRAHRDDALRVIQIFMVRTALPG